MGGGGGEFWLMILRMRVDTLRNEAIDFFVFL